MSKKLERVSLAMIFLMALGFRLAGLRWGLPYPYGHDGFFIISHAVEFFNGDFNPHWFIYPSFHMYFLFFIYWGIYGIGHLTGHFGAVHQFSALLNTDPSVFIITGRVVAAVFGSASVILCYLLAKKLFGRGVAFLTLMLVILPMEVLNSHYTTSDIPMTFWFLLTFIFCAGIMEKPDLKYYILAGLFTGIAGGTKYPGLGGVLPIITAHLMRLFAQEKKKKWRSLLFSEEHYKLITALGITGLAFFISTPYVFLDYKHSIPNIVGELNIRYTNTFDIYQRQNGNEMLIYIKEGFLNFGYLFVGLGLLGLVLRIKKFAKKEELLLLSWIIPFTIIIHMSALKPPRYFLTLSPFLLIFVANAITKLKERFEEKFSWGRYASIFIALLIPIQPLYHSIKNDIILIRPDTREEAHDWIIKNIPEGSLLAKELLWTPFLPKGRYEIVYDGWSLGDREISWYKEQKVEYFLVSEYMKNLMSHPDRPAPGHRRFYQGLEKEAEIIYTVSRKDKGLFMDFHNPTVFIYKLKYRS